MNPIDQTFQTLRSAGRKAFIPFITAGDPDLEMTRLLVRELSRRGAAIVELGVPYSDPIADGPVIQASYTRALDKGIKLAEILGCVSKLTSERGSELAPLVSMVSYAIVHRRGPADYIREAKQAGFSGAIVPDLPVEESPDLARLAADHDFKLIQLITPTTSKDRAARIAATSSGFIYYVSVTGITGERERLPEHLAERIAWLRTQTDLPIAVGFGISHPDQVRLLRDIADAVIVGSAIVRRVADASSKPRNQLVSDIGDFASTLIEALND